MSKHCNHAFLRVLLYCFETLFFVVQIKLEMWANAQRDGRPVECRWSPLFNAAKLG